MSAQHIILSSRLSVCQKLSNLVKIQQSSDKNNLGNFFGPPCICRRLDVAYFLTYNGINRQAHISISTKHVFVHFSMQSDMHVYTASMLHIYHISQQILHTFAHFKKMCADIPILVHARIFYFHRTNILHTSLQ